ncbi:MAG: cytidylate kinase-like family protein [Lachnospiraceae bacterium]|jgi:cytidylate kinase|nr:cytidylate kinase-like family protein [Lachnospiraceae bacterium]
MSGKKLPVITINREYGAGGRSLAAILSEKLGIPYYDRDFVEKTVEESGYDVEDVEREGEEMTRTSKVLNNFLNGTVSYSSSHDAIFKATKKVILKLAENPCIMVGRCANRILDEAGIDAVSIYLHAPLENRIRRAKELPENEGEEVSAKTLEEHDAQRRTFYKQYTGCEISDAAYYTFCFDVGKLSIRQCADIILGMLEQA